MVIDFCAIVVLWWSRAAIQVPIAIGTWYLEVSIRTDHSVTIIVGDSGFGYEQTLFKLKDWAGRGHATVFTAYQLPGIAPRIATRLL